MGGVMILKWAAVYGSLTCQEFDDLDTAIRVALAAADAGSEAFEGIEVIDEAGSRIVDVHARMTELEREENEQHRRAWDGIVAKVVLKAPPEMLTPGATRNAMSDLDWFRSFEEAEARAAELRPALGDRVSVEPVARLRLRPAL